MTINYNAAQPEAFITTNKNRRKVQGNDIYLENNTSFEIELFNPTPQVLLGKIKINGNYISDRGLILNPGQRVFLERHIESPEKFLFSTYEVNKENAVVAKAIENNGLIEIEFYPEKKEPIRVSPPYNPSPWVQPYIWSGEPTYYSSQNNGGTGGVYNVSTSAGISLDFMPIESELSRSFAPPIPSTLKRSRSKSLSETGRVEKGDVSNQTFRSVSKEFDIYYIHKITYKILPMSEKKIQVNELIKFCTSCGKRSRKEHRFCSSCGTKL